MLVLRPEAVSFAGEAWVGVESVAVERRAVRTQAELSGDGPHAVWADVPEQRVTIRVARSAGGDDLGGPALGAMGELTFETTANGSDADRARVRVTAVVTGVSYGADRGGGGGGGGVGAFGVGIRRTVEFIGLSADGMADPVTVERVG